MSLGHDKIRVMATAVYLEVGGKRVFACALAWPGWCRSGKTGELALETLASYVPRYAVVADQAGVAFPATAGDDLEVVERVPGSAGTDFGVPYAVAARDAEPVDAGEAERLTALVVASWEVFDRVAAGAPAELRKGPRGGGRDRDKMIDHVLGAEAGYARKLGIKQRQPALGDAAAIAELRQAIAAVLREPSDGTPPVAKGWPARYAARRIAWHVLDHAWEMEDRSVIH
jgi:hypothetical protein